MALGIVFHRLNDRAGGGQLLGENAGILGAGDGLKAVPGAGAALAANAGDLDRRRRPLRPVGDLAGESFV